MIEVDDSAPVNWFPMLVSMAVSAADFAAACSSTISVVGVDVAKWLSTSMSHVVAETMFMSAGIGGVHVHVARVECR